MPHSRIIMGIDPGFALTGYGFIETDGQTLQLKHYGCVTTTPKQRFVDRLQCVADEISAAIKEFKPDVIAIEELFFATNAKTAMQVGHARGVILLTALQAKVPIVEFTPLQVKQAITSYGRADKAQVQQMVKILLRLKEIPQPDDAADALAIAICASMHRTLQSQYDIR